MQLTREKILSLAPDNASIDRAQQCASPWRWELLSGNERVIWGLFKTPSRPFETAVDLIGPGFKCSCPSRKFPCKHSLGLALMLFQQPEAFSVGHEIPENIDKWITGRDKRNSKSAIEKVADERSGKILTFESLVTSERMALMKNGISELDLWLVDLMQHGLGNLKSRYADSLKNIAERMVDAKLGSLGRRLRQLSLLAEEADWHEKFLSETGEIYLLAKAFRKIERLPHLLQLEVLSQLGVNMRKEDILNQNGLWDEWMALGSVIGTEENLLYRRAWFKGAKTGSFAMILDFSFGNAGFDTSWPVGKSFEGEMVYYPGAYPLRSLLKNRDASDKSVSEMDGYRNLGELQEDYKKVIAKTPWINAFPVVLSEVVPIYKAEGSWFLQDKIGMGLPMQLTDEKGWKLMAVSGGALVSIFGEMESGTFKPLSMLANSRFYFLK